MKGEEHASARMASDYAKLLAGKLGERGSDVPVRLVDERLSTVSAHAVDLEDQARLDQNGGLVPA